MLTFGGIMDNHQLLALALRCGASLAGIADADVLRMSPSHRDTSRETLPKDARTVLVLALHHPRTLPELDYWGGEGGTRGNLSLIRMAEDIARQAESDLDICAVPLEYSPTDRGTFLKDAAVLAGMGVIGKSNLLITPEYGPRVRLRALALDTEWPATERRAEFDPCPSCAMPCRRVCPQAAFAGSRYDRSLCEIQMRIDESAPLGSADGYCVSYCRACELACPIGEIEAAGTAKPTTPGEGTDAPPVN
jgi:epoxyqueuosine reductase